MLSVELAHLGLLNYIPSMSPNGLELVPLIVHTKNNVTRKLIQICSQYIVKSNQKNYQLYIKTCIHKKLNTTNNLNRFFCMSHYLNMCVCVGGGDERKLKN